MRSVGWQTRALMVMIVVAISTSPLCAQLRIIPREKVEEATSPTVVEGKKMLFENDGNISFGTIGEDDEPWKATLHWRSTEGKTLTITRVKSSCGCLKCEWDRRAAVNATEGTLEVEYHPKGHSGTVRQRLFVYTTLSAEHPTAIVTIGGEVTPSEDHSSLYPHRMATLGLRNRRVSLPEEGGTIKVAVMNCGSTPLCITRDGRLTLGGVVAYTEPRVLESGEEGSLHIEWEPSGNNNLPIMLYLQGVNIPPRERKIEIEIEKRNK